MREQSVTTRQAGMMLFVAMICNKMLSLGSILSFDAKNDAWIIFVLQFGIDFLFSLIFLYFIKTIDKPILQYIKEKFGKVVSIVVAVLVGIIFLFKTTEVMVDTYLFFVHLIYADFDRVVFMACFLTIVYFFGSRQFRSLGRTSELLFALIVFSLAICFLMALKAIDVEKILPLFGTNFYTLGTNTIEHSLWFGDFWIFFFLIGNIKIEQKTTKKLIFSYLISCFVIILFVVMFICAFGHTASMHRVSNVDITEYAPRLIAQARFNWLAYFTFPISLVLGIGIYANCLNTCVKFCVREKFKSKNTISIFITTALVVAICVVFRFQYSPFYNFVTKYLFYYVLLVQYAVPIVLLLMINVRKRKLQKRLVAV
ncbi:MAG: GerAB/ArcD/ProY family transporter [Clostridia bacterium]|nr:GerAB/ArcD/ProY family transporter [Clostridia bacterium]